MTAPPHPPARKQLGYVRRLFSEPQPVLDELRSLYGGVVGLGAGPVKVAIIGDPAAMRELFAMPSESFRWGHKFNVLGFFVGDESMIVSDGADHARRRSSVQATFGRRYLSSWIPMIVAQTDAAIDRLLTTLGPSPTTTDLYPVGRSILINIMVRSLLGDRVGDNADAFGALFQRPQNYLEAPAYRQAPHRLPFTARSRVRADRRAIDAVIDGEIAAARAHPVDAPTTIVETLVNDGALTDDEIRDQLVTLVGAGYDTTSSSLAWTFVCAPRVGGLWDRLGREADDVFARTATADDTTLAALTLANRTMRETLRLHPAGAIAPREAAVDVRVGGYDIAKGTLVMWSAHLAGRDAAAWSNPLTFDPERFVDPSPDQKALADMAWVPFGRGPRNCIGFALAQMEMTLITARLAQRLTIEPVGGPAPKPVGMVVNRPTGGAMVRVSARN
ncbi:MAG: hypothetical protein QOJ00_2772 [Actinomycetota bacterium]